jgi:cytoskeletal protein RodZ
MIGTRIATISRTTGFGRRTLTILAIVASLAVGFLAIRAAASWTSAAAPLETGPVSVETLRGRLTDETDRTVVLKQRLGSLAAHASALQDALTAAAARLTSDAAHADDLAAQLAAAKMKLAELQRSVRDANQANQVRLATTSTASTAGAGSAREHEGGGDD